MLFHANILARNEDGIMERILRVCRHRGFGAHFFQATVDPDGETMQITIEGESQRSPVLLTRQIEKFYDVMEVSVELLKRETPVTPHEVRVYASPIRSKSYASTSHG